jgi:peptidoglycan/LPS O-acetylase OafA/YrhL
MTTRNHALDGIRGYAVFLVFMVHFCGGFPATYGALPISRFEFGLDGDWTNNLLFYWSRSHYGVDLFFVLSGYFICSILQSPKITAGQFLLNRFLRIYPAFLVSMVAALLIWHYVLRQPVALDTIAKNLLFLNGILFLQIPALNGVTWSLFYECTFYLGISLLTLCVGRKFLFSPGKMLVIGVCLAATLMISYGGIRGGMSLGLYLHMFVGAALAGTYGGQRFGEWIARIPTSIVLAVWFAYTSLFSLDIINYRNWYYYPISGIACALLISKAGLAPGPLNGLFNWRPFAMLGRISYSFYLLHALIITLTFSWPTKFSFAIMLLIVLTFSLLVACFSFCLAERPYFRRSIQGAKSRID